MKIVYTLDSSTVSAYDGGSSKQKKSFINFNEYNVEWVIIAFTKSCKPCIRSSRKF